MGVVNHATGLEGSLRLPADSELIVDGRNIVADIHDTLGRMEQIVDRVHAGQWRGFSGRPVDTIVNIGVGGSDLGPFMASKALADAHGAGARKLEIIFVSTMDGSQIAERLATLNPATTLFITKLLPVPVTALAIPVVLYATGVLPDARVALGGFGSQAALAIAAVFILGAGLKESGVATLLARLLQRRFQRDSVASMRAATATP